jgi:hypothetical protein
MLALSCLRALLPNPHFAVGDAVGPERRNPAHDAIELAHSSGYGVILD